MLTNLSVQNFAIIDNINIDFKKGFTVITGETGAGKSLIIDAIGILLGDRFLQSMIRTGETKACIEGTFDDLGPMTLSIMENLGYDTEEEILIIRRELNVQGRSIIRINNNMATLANLEQIANTLADIHTQEDTMKLFNKDNYLNFIDSSESLVVLNNYQIALKEYLTIHKKYKQLVEDYQSTLANMDYLRFQQNELQNANLVIDEEKAIIDELQYLNNYENIFNNLTDIKNSLIDNNITNELYEILQNLQSLEKIDKKYMKTKEIINNMYYDLEDIERNITNDLQHLEFDEERLNSLNERLSYLNSLMKKYHRNIPELIQYLQEVTNKINNYDSSDFLINETLEEVKKAFLKLKEYALSLTKIRKDNAISLINNIISSLKELMLDKVRLDIIFEDYIIDDYLDNKVFKKNGCDEVDFLISFNPGEAMHSLAKVASGGEMSRVMLAIKTHAQKKLHLATMIFDEIDTGISGQVASQVGIKLKEISQTTQVLAITHLPIVASKADEHLFITKDVSNERTTIKVKSLTYEERINEIAFMISPKDQSSKSQELAKMMLDNANK